VFEANAELPTGILKDYGLEINFAIMIIFSRTKFIHLHYSDQTGKATACCCLGYQI